jgi:hypothetical protein
MRYRASAGTNKILHVKQFFYICLGMPFPEILDPEDEDETGNF